MLIECRTAAEFATEAQSLLARRRYAAAIACYRRATTLEPDRAVFWNRLGHALWRDRRYDEAEAAVLHALALARGDEAARTESHHWLGSIYSDQGRIGQAIDAYNSALQLNPGSASLRLDRSLTFLLGGNLRTGFREYEARIDHLRANYPDMPMARWHGQDAMGKTVLVMAEQGIGDIIQFSRYLPFAAARCERLIFCGPAELAPLFEAWPKHVIAEYRPRNGSWPPADLYVPLCSLAVLHNTSIDTVPKDPGYFLSRAVTVLGDRRGRLPYEYPGKRHIGICWAGNPVHGRDADRSIALERLLEFAGDASIELYSFQVGQRAGDIEIVGAQSLICDLSPYLADWRSTAALLTRMDMVITVDSAVAHLAGALGVKTCLLVSRSPDWRWGTTDRTTPWYPSMIICRQHQIGDWSSAIDEVRFVLS